MIAPQEVSKQESIVGDNTIEKMIDENSIEVFGWYWQPPGSLKDLSANLATKSTQDTLQLAKRKKATKELCDKVQANHSHYYSQMKSLLSPFV